uniref:Uncharacterized protein n=1 Tax=Anguilla anguilla TaxID=7936 RepID=A0A0E9QV36_ANGAN
MALISVSVSEVWGE